MTEFTTTITPEAATRLALEMIANEVLLRERRHSVSASLAMQEYITALIKYGITVPVVRAAEDVKVIIPQEGDPVAIYDGRLWVTVGYIVGGHQQGSDQCWVVKYTRPDISRLDNCLTYTSTELVFVQESAFGRTMWKVA